MGDREAKSTDAKSTDVKPTDAKLIDARSTEAKLIETKPIDAEPIDVKPTEKKTYSGDFWFIDRDPLTKELKPIQPLDKQKANAFSDILHIPEKIEEEEPVLSFRYEQMTFGEDGEEDRAYYWFWKNKQ